MSLKLPLVSIIIPAYNAEQFILDSVNSALAQSYENFEVIVVNDGSTDKTLTFLNTIIDKRLIVTSIKNSGQCAAANLGLKLAKGEYIKFLDSDDLINSCHLEAMIKLATMHTDALVLCKWARFYGAIEDAKFINRPEWGNFSSIDWFNIALGNDSDMLPVWQWLIPKTVLIKSGGWNESLGLGNDFEFSSRLLMASNGVVFCNEAKHYYRSGLTTNMSVDTSPQTIYSVLRAIDMSKETIFKHFTDERTSKSYAKKYFTWLVCYYPLLRKRTTKEVEEKIKLLGGVKFDFDWGFKFNLLRKLFGWKISRKFQFSYYNFNKRYF